MQMVMAVMHRCRMLVSSHRPISSQMLMSASRVCKWASAAAPSTARLPVMIPALELTTLCAKPNTPITMSKVCVRMNTATKVLKIHLKMLKVSNSADCCQGVFANGCLCECFVTHFDTQACNSSGVDAGGQFCLRYILFFTYVYVFLFKSPYMH